MFESNFYFLSLNSDWRIFSKLEGKVRFYQNLLVFLGFGNGGFMLFSLQKFSEAFLSVDYFGGLYSFWANVIIIYVDLLSIDKLPIIRERSLRKIMSRWPLLPLRLTLLFQEIIHYLCNNL